jgi:hypothetical protein
MENSQINKFAKSALSSFLREDYAKETVGVLAKSALSSFLREDYAKETVGVLA